MRHLTDVEYLAVLWLVSTSGIVGFSVYCATRKPSQVNFGLAFVATLMGCVGYAAAFVFPGRFYAQIHPGEDLSTAMLFGLAALGVGTMWADAILVQLLQNFGYRLVGAPTQPIRWYSGSKPKRRGRLAK